MLFVVSKLFNAFFLPPGLFVLVFVYFAFKTRKTLKVISLTTAAFLYLISTKPVANLLLTPLENIIIHKNDTKFTILLGGGISTKDYFKFSNNSFKREVYAYIVAQNNTLIFTGADEEIKAFKEDYKIFHKYFGISVPYYITKPSYNTYQNAKNSAEMFEKNGWEKKIYLVTSAYHMKRSMKLFEHFGFEVVPKPVGFLKDEVYTFIDFIPSMENFYKSYVALHEYFGLLSLKLRGL